MWAGDVNGKSQFEREREGCCKRSGGRVVLGNLFSICWGLWRWTGKSEDCMGDPYRLYWVTRVVCVCVCACCCFICFELF